MNLLNNITKIMNEKLDKVAEKIELLLYMEEYDVFLIRKDHVKRDNFLSHLVRSSVLLKVDIKTVSLLKNKELRPRVNDLIKQGYNINDVNRIIETFKWLEEEDK